MRPPFISAVTAARILRTGKSINFLRSAAHICILTYTQLMAITDEKYHALDLPNQASVP